MMMAYSEQDFPQWLGSKLRELNTDETIFGSYIQGILDGDETNEDKNEALQSILSEIIENETEITKICNEIFEKWQLLKPQEQCGQQTSESVDEKLAKLLESQCLATTKQKRYTEEEKKIREAILSQYSQMSDEDEGNDEKSDVAGGGGGESRLEKNLNAQTVVHAEKLKREQARIDSQKKKEKDKEDREKQKQLKEEKKEKRKTVKGERRR